MVPSIYDITPAEGLASGRERVQITGAFFRLPEEPPNNVPTDGARRDTARVLFGGVPADLTAVLTDGLIVAVTPAYTGTPGSLPAAVDVTVQNLDDSGAPIAGEEYTLPGGYVYRRPDIVVASGIQWVTRQVLRDLRRNLIDNVASATSPDWASDPGTTLTAVAELPAVLVDGPTIEENAFYRTSAVEERANADGANMNAGPFTADLSWDIILLARRKTEALNLCDVLTRYVRRRPTFTFERGPSDTTVVECRRYLAEWRAVDRHADQVFSFESTLRLEALVIDDDAGMPVDDAVTYEVLTTDLSVTSTE